MAAVLQNDCGLRLDDAGTEAHEIALNKGNEIAFTVGGGDILCVVIAFPLFYSHPFRGRHRGGHAWWHCVNSIAGYAHSDLRPQRLDASRGEEIRYGHFHEIA